MSKAAYSEGWCALSSAWRTPQLSAAICHRRCSLRLGRARRRTSTGEHRAPVCCACQSAPLCGSPAVPMRRRDGGCQCASEELRASLTALQPRFRAASARDSRLSYCPGPAAARIASALAAQLRRPSRRGRCINRNGRGARASCRGTAFAFPIGFGKGFKCPFPTRLLQRLFVRHFCMRLSRWCSERAQGGL